MPPRYAYWTIIVDDQPTAFRSGAQDDLMPTFKRLQLKHPSAKMMWFQNGKLWDSRIDAQEQMRARGEMGRRGDSRQVARRSDSEDGSDRPPFRDRERPAFRKRPASEGSRFSSPRSETKSSSADREPGEKLDWKPKGEFIPAPKRSPKPDWEPKSSGFSKPRSDKPFDRERKPEWKPRSEEKPAWTPRSDEKPEWKPRSAPRSSGSRFPASGERPERSEWKPKRDTGDRAPWKPKSDSGERPDWKSKSEARPEWKPKGSFDRSSKPDWKPKSEWKPRSDDRRPRTSGSSNLDWTPKSGHTGPKPEGTTEKRKWVPKEEYKKSQGIEAKRDGKWRPGGLHKDPKQKYKDAKKAKWTKFKTTIRARGAKKAGKKDE